jgi:hypothetical protein
MNSSANSDIRQQERELFASMAKVRQPMAPDSLQTQLGGLSSQDFAEASRTAMKARFPSLTDKDLDELVI